MKKLVILAISLLAVFGAVTGALAYRGSSSSGTGAIPEQQGRQGVWLGATVVRTPDGLTIASVVADSPAHKAGLQRGDVIKAIDGAAVSDMAALRDALKDKQAGDTITLSITRNGTAQDVTVTLEARPEPLPKANPLLPELNGIPRDQLFSHLLGGSFQFMDSNNNTHTATVELGTVTAVDTGAKKITVQLNSGGSPKTYTIDQNVLTFPSDLAQFQSGDKVSIMSVDGALRAVVKGSGLMPFFGGKGGHGPHGRGGFGPRGTGAGTSLGRSSFRWQ